MLFDSHWPVSTQRQAANLEGEHRPQKRQNQGSSTYPEVMRETTPIVDPRFRAAGPDDDLDYGAEPGP